MGDHLNTMNIGLFMMDSGVARAGGSPAGAGGVSGLGQRFGRFAVADHRKLGWPHATHPRGRLSDRADIDGRAPRRSVFLGHASRAEIDQLLGRGDRLLGIECKRTDAPRLTPSIRSALGEVGLERVAVVYPGTKRYPLADRVEAVPLRELGNGGYFFDFPRRSPLPNWGLDG